MYLADTHILLWSLSEHPKLRAHHKAILDSDAVVYVSAASLWEIAIKKSIGKLNAPADLEAILPQLRFTSLHVTMQHAWAVANLPAHHGDPFDRLLAAQAKLENLSLLTVDLAFVRYGVSIV